MLAAPSNRGRARKKSASTVDRKRTRNTVLSDSEDGEWGRIIEDEGVMEVVPIAKKPRRATRKT
jgi:hypothetical protein